jgi:hypothetical protein
VLNEDIARPGELVVVVAVIPFGQSGAGTLPVID